MSLGLISIADNLDSLNVKCENVSDESRCFYLRTPSGLIYCNSRFSWRLTGLDGGELFSLDIIGGAISAIELILFNNIEFMDLNYSTEVNAMPGFPLVGFLPTVPPRGVVGEVAVDVKRDFYVERYNNCIRIFWGDASFRILAFEKICFEFSREFILVGVVVFDDGLGSFD